MPPFCNVSIEDAVVVDDLTVFVRATKFMMSRREYLSLYLDILAKKWELSNVFNQLISFFLPFHQSERLIDFASQFADCRHAAV